MRVFLLFALVLAGCSSSAVMVEEAEPHAASALQSTDGLEEYLVASGVGVSFARELTDPNKPGVVRAAGFHFTDGSRCTVLTYTSPETAEELAPKTVRRASSNQPQGGFAGYNAPSKRYTNVPTYFFGASVATCHDEEKDVKQALLALGAYAEANPAATG